MARGQRKYTSMFGPLLVLIVLIGLIGLSPLILVALSLYFVYSLLLYGAVALLWLPRGKDILFVYSNSPIWQSHIETNIIPFLRERSVLINWSERARWKRTSLGVNCFYHFGGASEFNPMAVVFRPFRRAKVFRFYNAFQDYKHGRQEALNGREREVFDYAGISDDPAA